MSVDLPDDVEEPSTRHAFELASRHRGAAPVSVTRFPLGLAHWVYEAQFNAGPSLVVRMTRPEHRQAFEGAVHWSNVLRPLGIPLPARLEHGEYQGLPFLVLERLAGDDLGAVYRQLRSSDREQIAREVSRLQRIVATLPEAPGFGSVALPAGPYHPSWGAFIEELIAMCRQRIAATGVIGTALFGLVFASEQGQSFNRAAVLFYAVNGYPNDADLVALLLRHGARAHVKANDGTSALDHAKRARADEKIIALLTAASGAHSP